MLGMLAQNRAGTRSRQLVLKQVAKEIAYLAERSLAVGVCVHSNVAVSWMQCNPRPHFALNVFQKSAAGSEHKSAKHEGVPATEGDAVVGEVETQVAETGGVARNAVRIGLRARRRGHPQN